MANRKVQNPQSSSAGAAQEANDEVLASQAAADAPTQDSPTDEGQREKPVPDFSEEQQGWILEQISKAAQEGYAKGREAAAKIDLGMAKSSDPKVVPAGSVDPTKIEKAVLSDQGWICPKPRLKKTA